MKLSCLPVSFFGDIIADNMSVKAWAEMGQELGLDAVDLSVLFFKRLDSAYLAGFRKDIESAGMKVAMVSSYPDFTHPDPAERKKQLEEEKAYIEAVGEIGGEMIRITAGQAHPGLREEDGLCWAFDGLMACEDTARKCGVRLMFENHATPGCWPYPDFDYPTHIFLTLARQLEQSGIYINFDTANPIAYGDEPVPILSQVIDRVYTIHAADTGTRGSLNHVLLGTGLVPFAEIFSYLRQVGYDGWICIEENSRLGRQGVEDSVAFVRRVWDEAGA